MWVIAWWKMIDEVNINLFSLVVSSEHYYPQDSRLNYFELYEFSNS